MSTPLLSSFPTSPNYSALPKLQRQATTSLGLCSDGDFKTNRKNIDFRESAAIGGGGLRKEWSWRPAVSEPPTIF